jgi:hypothetical protein
MWIGARTGWKVVAVVHYFVVLRKFTASTAAGAKIKGGRLELVQNSREFQARCVWRSVNAARNGAALRQRKFAYMSMHCNGIRI